MNKLLFNYYWTVASLISKIYLVGFPLILLAAYFDDELKLLGINSGDVLIDIIITVVIVGWSAISIVYFYKCPSCNKRALVHSGTVAKKLTLNRSVYKSWIIPDELISQYFYCCKCAHKIKAK